MNREMTEKHSISQICSIWKKNNFQLSAVFLMLMYSSLIHLFLKRAHSNGNINRLSNFIQWNYFQFNPPHEVEQPKHKENKRNILNCHIHDLEF